VGRGRIVDEVEPVARKGHQGDLDAAVRSSPTLASQGTNVNQEHSIGLLPNVDDLFGFCSVRPDFSDNTASQLSSSDSHN
jgi:hypothetical protein